LLNYIFSFFSFVKCFEGIWEAQALLRATDVWLDTADGVRSHAWGLRTRTPLWSLSTLHCNAGNITHRYPQFREIQAAGSAILALGLHRGYGKRHGQPTESGLDREAEAAYDHLLKTAFVQTKSSSTANRWAPPPLWTWLRTARARRWCSKRRSHRRRMWRGQ
jgi:hypothetical protein